LSEAAREIPFLVTAIRTTWRNPMGIRIEWEEKWTCAKTFTRKEALAFVNANSSPKLADDSTEEVIKEAMEGMQLDDDLSQIEWDERDEADVEREVIDIS
jgi:hypothetical protein